ncbi:MAG: hypothetical protein IT435_02030 [Phycisphaerales bacterium]|nr:hypothetical protein [Phycisphaerales bacterium]
MFRLEPGRFRASDTMGEAAPHIQDPEAEDLASQLENLLGESPPANADQTPRAEYPTPENATPEKPTAENETAAPARFIQGGEESSRDLDQQVAQMLGDAISKVNQIREHADAAHTPQHPHPPQSPAPHQGGLEVPVKPAVDGGGEQEPASKPQASDDEAPAAVTPEPPHHVSGAARTGFGPRWEQKTPAAEPAIAEPPLNEVVSAPAPAASAPAPAPPPPPQPAPVQQPRSEPDAAPIARPSLLAVIVGILALILRPLWMITGKVIMLVAAGFAKPLEKRKPIVRDSLGWLAIVTVFMGACMWAAAILRDPKAFVPEVPPKTVLTADGHGGGGHGKDDKRAPAKKDAHGGDSHGKKDDGHGGGHGAAAAAPVKREPLIQRGPGAKKPAKKPDAPGGH